MMLYPSDFGNDPLFPSAETFAVIHKDNSTGKGVITYRSFKKGEIIARIARNIVPEIRQYTLQVSATEHNDDPYFSGYFLHSCEPNVSVDMQKMTVTALKDIPANSFIYMDYAETEDYLYKQFPCFCGAPNCRRWITGRLEISSKSKLRTQALTEIDIPTTATTD